MQKLLNDWHQPNKGISNILALVSGVFLGTLVAQFSKNVLPIISTTIYS